MVTSSHIDFHRDRFLSLTPVGSVSFLPDPLADIRRTICEPDAPLLAMLQNPDRVSIHEGQILQVQDHQSILAFQFKKRLQFGHVSSIQAAYQPKDGHPIRNSLNP
jgi:hypothetical protein